MADWSYSNISTLVTSAGTFTFNHASNDTVLIDPSASTGLGTSQVRTSIFKKGQASGYFYAAPFLEEGQHLVLTGVVRITSAATDTATVTARDVVLTSLRTHCKAILATEGTLTIGSDTLAVRCEMLPEPHDAFLKTVTFGLVAAAAA